jgi:hypothetical protein
MVYGTSGTDPCAFHELESCGKNMFTINVMEKLNRGIFMLTGVKDGR